MPPECVLLIAVPLSREDFDRSCAYGEATFASVFRAARRALTKEAVWEAYSPYAALALEVIAEARRSNIEVTTSATLSHLSQYTRSAKVVTVIAHWRSAAIQPADIVHPRAVRDALGGITTLEPAELAKALNAVDDGELQATSPLLAEARRLVAREYAWWNRRRVLDERAPGAVRGGPAVEFSDGFQPLADVVAAVPTDCGGLIDLTVCNSVLLGEEIRRACANCVVLMNAASARLDFRLALYKQVIGLMRRRRWSYREAAIRFRNHILEA